MVDEGPVRDLVSGMTKVHAADPQQMERVLDMALDGLRYRPDA